MGKEQKKKGELARKLQLNSCKLSSSQSCSWERGFIVRNFGQHDRRVNIAASHMRKAREHGLDMSENVGEILNFPIFVVVIQSVTFTA